MVIGMGNKLVNIVLRFFKGAAMGMDFVLPGISGAALSVVFGLYERIIGFLANITKGFIKNFLFFLPVGIGGLLGIYMISHPMSFLLENYKTPVLWFFVGAIIGTMPDLWRRSSAEPVKIDPQPASDEDAVIKKRKPRHIIILLAAFFSAVFILLFSGGWVFGQIILNPVTAAVSGGIVALIALIPGFSSSNFLVLFGLYDQMINSYRDLNFAVLVPFALSMIICVLPFSKGVEFLLKKAYLGFFHVILGFVLASAVLVGAIASGWQQPEGYYNYLQLGTIACVITFAAGAAFSFWMCKLSEKYEK